jgi:hypothetical protein
LHTAQQRNLCHEFGYLVVVPDGKHCSIIRGPVPCHVSDDHQKARTCSGSEWSEMPSEEGTGRC